ncbi:MAG: TatD DNase family protein [Gammaproteobacteria bacterium]|jgi:TatD DNase family protein
MIEMIDIGVNLTNKSLSTDLEGVLQRASLAGVKQMVVTGTSLEDSRMALELCQKYPGQLVSTCGLHPHHASDWDDSSRLNFETIAGSAEVRAIGETGLDFNRNYSPEKAQEIAFRQQIELAIKLGKPLFCHQRDAHSAFVAIISEYRDQISRLVVHCFTDNRQALLDYLDLDCHIGITGWICDERRGLDLQQLVKLIPDDRLMLETDAPYLLPRSLKPKPKSRINEPCHLPHILQQTAIFQNKPIELLAQQCLKNTRQFFDI